jgi:replicative DNA helicase
MVASMPDKPFDPANAIYTPQEVALYGRLAVENMASQKSRGLVVNIASLKDYFAPLLPGQVCAVIAQTSHYKSGLLHFIEHEAAVQLQNENRIDEILVHVSVEEGVEEQSFLEFARETGDDPGKIARGEIQDWSKLYQAVVKVGSIPIFRIGESLARAEESPNLYMSNMIRAIRHLAENMLTKFKIAGLFFDYLQAFPIDPEHKSAERMDQRRLQVRSDIYRLRQAANYFNCPVFVAVQAKQQLDGANPPIMLPGVYDGEESSSIAQRCDRVLSLWMPARTHTIGETISARGMNFTVDPNLLFIKVAKQRGGLPAGRVFKCRINFERNLIAPEMRP